MKLNFILSIQVSVERHIIFMIQREPHLKPIESKPSSPILNQLNLKRIKCKEN